MKVNLNNADYLHKSGALSKEQLEEDSTDVYDEKLSDSNTDDFFKKLIKDFLLPFRISSFKFIFNKDYFEGHWSVRMSIDESRIAPSLVKLVNNPEMRAAGYPKWFYLAFPDVAWWALAGEGLDIIRDRFGHLPASEVIEGDKLESSYLKMIINLYKEQTNNHLECSIYDDILLYF